MEFKFKNVNDAFRKLVQGFHDGSIATVEKASRNGPVRMVEEPVTICYENPRQRVLFNQARDCNPFFHLYESLWMLAGRNDVDSLTKYVKTMIDFSDDGETFNGAYGRRWRNGRNTSPGVDQIRLLIEHLDEKPESRRAVLQMWNVEDDLTRLDCSKDVCCNLSVMFSIRHTDIGPVLDMTVTNRSNDMIWGTLGANVVHFSFLQEYVANRLGIRVGKYYQITNNLHVYLDNWEPQKWLDEYYYRTAFSSPQGYDQAAFYRHEVGVTDVFDKELKAFTNGELDQSFEDPFLNDVALPMVKAFELHKERKYDLALLQLERIGNMDWRIVASNWIAKRMAKWELKNK